MNRKLRKRHLHPSHGSRMKGRMCTAVALAGLALGAVSPLHAQTLARAATESRQPAESAAALDARWRESLDAFAALDRERAPAPGGVVFVGSSSIRLWSDLERDFESVAVVKRGFGGSRLSDCARYVTRLVLPYRPRLVVVYAGENDLAEGAKPEQVLASYAELVDKIHAALPETRIVYLSIKPSPLREALMPLAIQTNEAIEGWSKRDARLGFIDIYTRMLDAGGRPRAELFQADRLHLNADGYAIWKAAIASHLQ